MSSVASSRLANERRNWRRKHPAGFYARPLMNPDGSTNLFSWECGIPGKVNTLWEGGNYKVRLDFPESYPSEPPACRFDPVVFHPNVWASGKVCLSLLDAEKDWRASVTVQQLLLGIQDLLAFPNERDPAQGYANNLYMNDRPAYEKKIREQAIEYAAL